MYYGTRDWLKRLESLGRIRLTLFDPRDPAALAASLQQSKTDLVWIETPLNPDLGCDRHRSGGESGA